MKPVLFETLQFRSGKIFFLQEHLDRLLRAARHFKIKRGRVRMTLEPYPFLSPLLYKRGADLIIARSIRNDPPSQSCFKTLPRRMKEVAAREAKRKKAGEAILLNRAGRVTECSSSNIFLVKKGILMTPPLSEGLLDGITRQQTIQLARRLKIPIQIRPISPQQLFQADEIFITSSLKEILPIRKIDKKRVGQKVPGPVTQQLMIAYTKNLRR